MSKLALGQTAAGRPFKLSLDLITQTIAILAKRGVGKSYLAAVLSEELLDAGQQVVIIDPTGAHWGLRSSADGKAAGFPIVVIGGDHADLPLEEGSGEIIARAIIEQRFSAILDLSLLRKGAANRLVGQFLEALYRLNREPLHLICDEADTFAPQRVMGDEARTCGAMEDVAKKGRIRGLGMTLITQRPAVLNKNVLTQCEVLVAMRLVHPKDIGAIDEWVGVHGDPAQARDMIKSLPSLPVGSAWFWSPGWGDIFERVAIRTRRTFDSSATPKPGQRQLKPTALAKIDVERLGAEIAATVERAKADDPKELRRQIVELQRELAAKAAAKMETSVLSAQEANLVERFAEALNQYCKDLDQAAASIREMFKRLDAAIQRPHFLVPAPIARTPVTSRPANYLQAVQVSHKSAGAAGSTLSKAERRVLTALAQYPSGRAKNQVAILTGYAVNGGGFNNAISFCRTRGYLTGGGEQLVITEAGQAALGPFEPLPSGDALLQHWYEQLGKAERACLSVLVAAHPRSLTKEEVAARAGYEAGGGGFNNALSKLRTLELITGRGDLRASDDLFG